MENNVLQLKHYQCKRSGFCHGPYFLDRELNYVECGSCGNKLSPIDVLIKLASKESNLKQRFDSLREAIKKLESRFRAKCEHCGKMTNIRNNKS